MQIVESVESIPDMEAREERRCAGRRAPVGHGLDMEDLAPMCERQCRKACNLRPAAEELEGSGSNSRAWRYRKRWSPKPAAEARAMETDPSQASGGQPPPPGGGHVGAPEKARGVTTPRLGSRAPGKAGNGRAGGAG